MRKIRPHLTYANVVATLGLFIALGGASAFAAVQLGKNSVGSRQLKAKSVTTGKIALNAVNGSRVANGTLTGEDIKLSALGTVPSATTATSAGNANTVGGHAASCPTGTTLLRGTCYDTHSNGEAPACRRRRCLRRPRVLPLQAGRLADRLRRAATCPPRCSSTR